MPLSSVLGAQSLVRPGVCTSTTRPASPFEGQVIYETDTDNTLVYNGTAWVYLSTSRANPVGMDLISSTTIGTAVSSVDVTNCFSATYDQYLVSWRTYPSTTLKLRAQLVDSSGTAITTGYYYGGYYTQYTSTTLNGDVQSNGSSYVVGSISATAIGAGQFTLLNPFVTDISYMTTQFTDAGNPYHYSGYNSSILALPSLKITTSTGTVTGGYINVYGYAK